MNPIVRLVLTFGLMWSLGGGPASAAVVVKLGHDQPEKSPHHEGALKWRELVESRTKGQVQVKIFASQLIGTGTEMVEMLQAGALEAGLIPTAKIAPITPSVQVLDIPFLFPSRDVAYKVIDGRAGNEILKPLRSVNIEGVAFWESGFKQFTGNFPIREPQDYKGRKIRVMPAPVIVEQFRAFGATPVPIDFKELYNALQQGVVDGQENPLATNITMRFYEVQKYLTLSDHAFLAYVFLFSKTFLDKLSPEVRTILVEAAKEAGRYERQLIADSEKEYLATMQKAGVEVIRLTPEQRAAFERAAKPVQDWYAQKYGREVLDAIQKDIAAVTGRK